MNTTDFEVHVIRHASWCNVEWDNGPCDCGGNEGRCPICNALGPCGFIRDGDLVLPAFCSMLAVRPHATSEHPSFGQSGDSR